MGLANKKILATGNSKRIQITWENNSMTFCSMDRLEFPSQEPVGHTSPYPKASCLSVLALKNVQWPKDVISIHNIL